MADDRRVRLLLDVNGVLLAWPDRVLTEPWDDYIQTELFGFPVTWSPSVVHS